MPCPQGYYCPHQSRMQMCPGIMTFLRAEDGIMVTVPTTSTSPVPAYKLEHCNCSAAGGFEASPSSQALFGCIACEDGYYSPPSTGGSDSSSRCKKCPAGTYASQQSVCPISMGGVSLLGHHHPCSPSSSSMRVAVGASACTACPMDKPYTLLEVIAKGIEDCRQCPEEHYYDDHVKRSVYFLDACIFYVCIAGFYFFFDTGAWHARQAAKALHSMRRRRAQRRLTACVQHATWTCATPGWVSTSTPKEDALAPSTRTGLALAAATSLTTASTWDRPTMTSIPRMRRASGCAWMVTSAGLGRMCASRARP